jgi:hypothetical protein
MPDDRIYDAINLFRFGPQPRSADRSLADATYIARYRELVNHVTLKLWHLYNADEISYSFSLPWTKDRVVFGRSQAGSAQHDVQIHQKLAPSRDPAHYGSLDNQALVAATSLILVHEASHLVPRSRMAYHEDEIVCRTMEALYGELLIAGKTYRSRVANAECTAILMPLASPAGDVFHHAANLRIFHQRNHIVDHVLTMDAIGDRFGYLRDLTPEWIETTLRRLWWGGLPNRWNATKALYFKILARQVTSRDRAEWLVKILESIPDHQNWSQARPVIENPPGLLMTLLASAHLSRNPDLGQRYARELVRLGENVAHPSMR